MLKFKFNAIFGLKPGIDPDETYQMWRGEHALYAKNLTLPEVKRYNTNKVIHRFGDVPIEDMWGIAEFWFDDLASTLKATERMRSAPPDEFFTEFAATPKMVIAQEEAVAL